MLNRDLRKVIVVDKDARAFSPTPSNGITVKPFSFKDQKDLEDRQLKTVTELIKRACCLVPPHPGLPRRRCADAPPADVVREGPEDVREVLSDLQSRGDDALKVFEEDCARREAEDKQKMERSVVNRLKASLDKKDAGKEAGTASTLPADQARLLEKRQQQQEQQLEQGGAQARTSNGAAGVLPPGARAGRVTPPPSFPLSPAVEDIRQAAERARAWALAQYTVGLVGMPPQAAYAERAAEAQEQAQSLSGMLGGAGGPQMPSAPPPPPKLPTKHATITGREPEAPTLWMRVKSWADEKQEEQQMIMADFQRQQMEAFQRQQMAEQAKKEQEQEQEYEARAREIAQKRNRIQRAKEAQQVQAQPDTA